MNTDVNSCSLQYTLTIAYRDGDDVETETVQCFDLADVNEEMRTFVETMGDVVVESVRIVRNW